jgi:hypothetical protein
VSKVPQSTERLFEQLQRQYDFLRHSGDAFDNGYEAEAARLATTVRVLVHDTNASHSLLGQLSLKETIDFVDTAFPYDPANLAPHTGLTMTRMSGGNARTIARLGMQRPSPATSKRFDTWWNATVVKAPDGVQWSRQKIVCTLANQDGGAHVDRNLDAEYERAVLDPSFGWIHVVGPHRSPLEGGIIPVSMRQISYEMERTIEPFLG